MSILRLFAGRSLAIIGLTRISDILSNMKDEPGFKKAYKMRRICKCWQLLGQPMSSCSAPVGFRYNTLFVKCKDSIWAQELSMMKDQICDKLKPCLKDIKIDKMVFHI